MIVSLRLNSSLLGADIMKRFSQYVIELYTNNLKKGYRSTGGELGVKPHPDAKPIGKTEDGDTVHHREINHYDGSTHHYYVTGKSGKTNIHLSTYQKRDEKAEEIGLVTANKSSKGAHKLYQHLVVKHNKILKADDHSEGGRKVWERAAKHPKVNVHGYDDETGEVFHAHPSEDEHYVSHRELNAHSGDAAVAKNPKDFEKHKEDIKHLEKTQASTHLIMHKK